MSKLEQLQALRRGPAKSVTAPTPKPTPVLLDRVVPPKRQETELVCPDCLKRREAKRVAQAKWRKNRSRPSA